MKELKQINATVPLLIEKGANSLSFEISVGT
jgi:hypothetical protein